MGCDIHGIIEQRKLGGQWEESSVTIDLGRNYSVFDNLAGLRGLENPVAANRGLPPDASEESRISSSKGGIYHSHSWCTIAELQLALARAGSWCDSYSYLVGVMGITMHLGHECRFVFWFDN